MCVKIQDFCVIMEYTHAQTFSVGMFGVFIFLFVQTVYRAQVNDWIRLLRKPC